MKPLRLLLPLSCLLALTMAGCVGPTPTVAPGVTPATVPPNTDLPPGYPADSTPTGPNSGYPAPATPTAAVIVATGASSSTPAEVQATDVPPTDVPVTDTPLPGPTATAARAFITYQDDGQTFSIVPAQTNIKVGTTVIFLIKSTSGALHQPFGPLEGPPFTFESPNNLGNDTSWPFTFTQAGTMTISCGFHDTLMRATLVIEP